MVTRRTLLTSGTFGFVSSLLRSETKANSSGPPHTFVFVTLQGGIDHAQYWPVFKSPSALSDKVHFASNSVFESFGIPFLNTPKALSPGSTFLTQFGHRLTVAQGIIMDGQNGHNAALSVLAKGSTDVNGKSVGAVLAELLGHGTQYGCVSFGTPPFHNSNGLSQVAQGIVLPQNLSKLEEQMTFPPDADGMTGRDFLKLANQFAQDQKQSALFDQSAQPAPNSDLGIFRQAVYQTSIAERDAFTSRFAVPQDLWNQMKPSVGPYGVERYQQFALASSMIMDGNSAAVYLLNVGRTQGFLSYDTHLAPNDEKQQDLLNRDLRALEFFLSSIESKLDSTTVIIGTEFGRSPLLNPGSGKDHWGASNNLLILSPFIKPGIVGAIDEGGYIAAPVSHSDNTSVPLRCRALYRALVQTLVDRDLTTCPKEMRDLILRQFVPGPIPVGFLKG